MCFGVSCGIIQQFVLLYEVELIKKVWFVTILDFLNIVTEAARRSQCLPSLCVSAILPVSNHWQSSRAAAVG